MKTLFTICTWKIHVLVYNSTNHLQPTEIGSHYNSGLQIRNWIFENHMHTQYNIFNYTMWHFLLCPLCFAFHNISSTTVSVEDELESNQPQECHIFSIHYQHWNLLPQLQLHTQLVYTVDITVYSGALLLNVLGFWMVGAIIQTFCIMCAGGVCGGWISFRNHNHFCCMLDK